MKIIDEGLLNSFRGPGVCEWCRKPVRNRHPHHIFSRGAGRVDLAINTISLCETFTGGDNCHGTAHDGNISRNELLKIVAEREKTTVGRIEKTMNRLRLIPKTMKKVRKK